MGMTFLKIKTEESGFHWNNQKKIFVIIGHQTKSHNAHDIRRITCKQYTHTSMFCRTPLIGSGEIFRPKIKSLHNFQIKSLI